MKNGFFALVATLLFGFSAQASLNDYAGTYNGKFEGRQGTLTISVSGDVMSASFLGANGTNDILGGACGSTIGRMVDIDMDEQEVDHVTFAFDPGGCAYQVQGRELLVDFKHKKSKVSGANLMIYAYTTFESKVNCYPTGHGHTSCYPESYYQDWYAMGKFTK